jgi:hypothetical protein
VIAAADRIEPRLLGGDCLVKQFGGAEALVSAIA